MLHGGISPLPSTWTVTDLLDLHTVYGIHLDLLWTLALGLGKMAATVALQTSLPLGLVQVRDVAVQGVHHSKKHTLPMCKECRRHLSSGLKSSSQHGVGKTSGRVSTSSGREGAFEQGRLGQSVSSLQSTWSGRRVRLNGGSSRRPSLQLHAQEPDDAEKDVKVKEALLRDALSEKNKKTEEVQQTGFKGQLSATDFFL
jgi:hypothetical protein